MFVVKTHPTESTTRSKLPKTDIQCHLLTDRAWAGTLVIRNAETVEAMHDDDRISANAL